MDRLLRSEASLRRLVSGTETPGKLDSPEIDREMDLLRISRSCADEESMETRRPRTETSGALDSPSTDRLRSERADENESLLPGLACL